jgi:hypothetical protein
VPGLVAAAGRGSAPRAIVRDALAVTIACALVGIVVNLSRSNGIPLVQKTAYQILVPCPESTGRAPAIAAIDPAVWQACTLLVDARSSAEHRRWHPEGAMHLPYDFLEPATEKQVHHIASSGASRVVVFGDGADPDCGEQLAHELAGAGIRNVYYVQGGAQRLRAVAASRGAR